MTSTSASDVWAVGAIGTGSQALPLILHYDGTAWSQQPTPAGTQGLNAVSASAPDDAWAVGGSILHWDGHSWTQVPAPHNGAFSVAGISPHSAVAVGTISTASGQFQNLVRRWDGQAWTRVASPDKGNLVDILQGVAVDPAGVVWTAGFFSIASIGHLQTAAQVFATVLDVAGQSRAAAIDAMNTAGLTSTVTEVTTAGGGCTAATNGTIIATTPPAGTFTAPPVSLSLCHLSRSQTVPSVVNDTDAAARTALTEAGLTTGTVTLVPNCNAPRGIVLSQNPAAGTTAAPGTPVSLTESTGRAAGGRPCA